MQARYIKVQSHYGDKKIIRFNNSELSGTIKKRRVVHRELKEVKLSMLSICENGGIILWKNNNFAD